MLESHNSRVYRRKTWRHRIPGFPKYPSVAEVSELESLLRSRAAARRAGLRGFLRGGRLGGAARRLSSKVAADLGLRLFSYLGVGRRGRARASRRDDPHPSGPNAFSTSTTEPKRWSGDGTALPRHSDVFVSDALDRAVAPNREFALSRLATYEPNVTKVFAAICRRRPLWRQLATGSITGLNCVRRSLVSKK